MARQQFTIGLRGLLKPEVDKRSSRRMKEDVRRDLEEVEEIQPDVNTAEIQKSLDEVDFGGAVTGGPSGARRPSGSAARVGGPARRGGTGGSALAGAGGGLLGAGGGLAKIALGGVVAVGMLSALRRIKRFMKAASPHLSTSASMMSQAMELFFRPFGKFLDNYFRPMAKSMLNMAKNFNQSVGEKGLLMASVEGITGVDFTGGSGAEKVGGGTAAAGGAGIGAFVGFKSGAALGATAGSVIPGAGTAVGAIVGGVIGAIVGAISGSAIGGRVGSAIADMVEGAADMVSDSWPGWPDVTGAWPGWPNIGTPDMPDWSGLTPSLPDWSDLNPFGGSDETPTTDGFRIPDSNGDPNLPPSSTQPPGHPREDSGGGGDGGFFSFIPGLATGGVVRRPTNAVIGEAGPEAVIPLSRMGEVMRQEGAVPASRYANQPASSEDIGRVEGLLETLIDSVENLGGDVVLEADGRRLGEVSTDNAIKFRSDREILK